MTGNAIRRSQRLNQITNEPHQKLDALVKAHKPFDTRENFARFVVAQYLFQSELQALYTQPLNGGSNHLLVHAVVYLNEVARAER